MNWNQSKSLLLSKMCAGIFACLLAAMDVGAWWLARWFVDQSDILAGLRDRCLLLVTLYCCSVLAWVILYALWRLLGSMRTGAVFTPENVRHLRLASWCCFGVGAVLLVSCLYYVPFVLLALIAGFIGLIIRIIKNVFAQALEMKDELDFTV